MKMVIDGDLMKCLEKFEASQTQVMLEKYIKLGKWSDISVDCNGDIVLYEDE